MKVEFKDVYKIGLNKIDEQHKRLFDTFNELDLAISRDEGKQVIGDVLEFLLKYCDEHFKTEEAYFEKYKYPQGAAH